MQGRFVNFFVPIQFLLISKYLRGYFLRKIFRNCQNKVLKHALRTHCNQGISIYRIRSESKIEINTVSIYRYSSIFDLKYRYFAQKGKN